MYNDFFGFSEPPFNITPNSRFFFSTRASDDIVKILKHGILYPKGIMVVTGEPGTGKTLLLKFLQHDLAATVESTIIQISYGNFDTILEVILERFNLRGVAGNQTARLDCLTAYLTQQRRQSRVVCLLVDEAQDLDAETLDELRLLANLEIDGAPLIAIVLIGQPELNVKLDQPAAARIKQRIALSRNTYPLVRMEIAPYIHWRLKVAGFEESRLFDAEAIDAIAAYSGGIPRLINSICDNSLIRAYTTKQRLISPAVVDQVARDLRIAGLFSFDRQFAPIKRVGHCAGSAPVAQPAKYPSEALTPVAAVGQDAMRAAEINQLDTAQTQDSSPQISDYAEADVGANGGKTTAPDITDYLKTTARERASSGGLPGIHADTDVTRDFLPVRLRWYAAATVAGLLLLGINFLSSSRLANFFSTAPNAKRTPSWDNSPYRSSQRDTANSVEFTGTLVALSNTTMTPPTTPERALSAAKADGKLDRQFPTKIVNGKKTAPLKASQLQAPRDLEPQRKTAANLPAPNRNRSAHAEKSLKVTSPSLLRKKPSASAAIISSLEPGSRVVVLAKSGDFYHIRSLDKQPMRGYIHREDAFFERAK